MRVPCLLATLLLAAGVPATAQRLIVTDATVTDLGTLGGPNSWAYDINVHGNIVGAAQAADGTTRGFYYSAGTMYDVSYSSNCSWSEARGINYHNQVVGTCGKLNDVQHAFRWANGVMSLLNHADPNGWPIRSSAVATTDSGLILGSRKFVDDSNMNHFATVWVTNDQFIQLRQSPYGWPNWANDINQSGVAVGYDKDWERPPRWRLQWPNVIEEGIPGPPGALSAYFEPLGINAHGNMVGKYECGYPRCRAWYWDGKSANSTLLGVIPTGDYAVAEDINDTGFIAGYGNRLVPGIPPFVPSTRVDAGFLYHPDFGMYALPAPAINPWVVASCRAFALNERRKGGWLSVAGSCTTGNGNTHAVRWDVTVRYERTPLGG